MDYGKNVVSGNVTIHGETYYSHSNPIVVIYGHRIYITRKHEHPKIKEITSASTGAHINISCLNIETVITILKNKEKQVYSEGALGEMDQLKGYAVADMGCYSYPIVNLSCEILDETTDFIFLISGKFGTPKPVNGPEKQRYFAEGFDICFSIKKERIPELMAPSCHISAEELLNVVRESCDL